MAVEKDSSKEKGAAEAAPAASGSGGWWPVLAIVVLVPALSWALAEFVLFPRLQQRLADPSVAAPAKSAASTGHPAGESRAEPTYSYEFKDIVSNLAGSMKSRYIKVSFTAYSSRADFGSIIDNNKAKVLDATLGVLSSLSLADLEDATIKNKVRTQLVFAFDSALHDKVVEEIYFSEFVIQ